MGLLGVALDLREVRDGGSGVQHVQRVVGAPLVDPGVHGGLCVARVAEGDRLDAVITNIDRRDHKLTLSIKAHEIKEEKMAMAEYGSSDSGASLGDILGAAMRKAEGENAGAADDEPAAAEKPEAPEAVEAKALEETAAEDEAGDVEDNEDNEDNKDKE